MAPTTFFAFYVSFTSTVGTDGLSVPAVDDLNRIVLMAVLIATIAIEEPVVVARFAVVFTLGMKGIIVMYTITALMAFDVICIISEEIDAFV